ncbi:11200_t:CDS:2 [Diversispora eburnea]|uniref:11200_t:CDS:1 n=1 Tax=Diversispora eburnea TaxID=1213867 RepID=A0A9N8WKL1_9GLOM|nr:11200_t:CDS:2 [Diversispora eburnea]
MSQISTNQQPNQSSSQPSKGEPSEPSKSEPSQQSKDKSNQLSKIEPSHLTWTEEENKRLLKLIEKYGPKWHILAKFFNQEENKRLFELIGTYGQDWYKLEEFFNNRPYYSIRYHYSKIRARLWTPEETTKLYNSAIDFGVNNKESWDNIKLLFPNRTLKELKEKYGELNNRAKMKFGEWTKDEHWRFEKALNDWSKLWKEGKLSEYQDLWRNISDEESKSIEKDTRSELKNRIPIYEENEGNEDIQDVTSPSPDEQFGG